MGHILEFFRKKTKVADAAAPQRPTEPEQQEQRDIVQSGYEGTQVGLAVQGALEKKVSEEHSIILYEAGEQTRLFEQVEEHLHQLFKKWLNLGEFSDEYYENGDKEFVNILDALYVRGGGGSFDINGTKISQESLPLYWHRLKDLVAGMISLITGSQEGQRFDNDDLDYIPDKSVFHKGWRLIAFSLIRSKATKKRSDLLIGKPDSMKDNVVRLLRCLNIEIVLDPRYREMLQNMYESGFLNNSDLMRIIGSTFKGNSRDQRDRKDGNFQSTINREAFKFTNWFLEMHKADRRPKERMGATEENEISERVKTVINRLTTEISEFCVWAISQPVNSEMPVKDFEFLIAMYNMLEEIPTLLTNKEAAIHLSTKEIRDNLSFLIKNMADKRIKLWIDKQLINISEDLQSWLDNGAQGEEIIGVTTAEEAQLSGTDLDLIIKIRSEIQKIISVEFLEFDFIFTYQNPQLRWKMRKLLQTPIIAEDGSRIAAI